MEQNRIINSSSPVTETMKSVTLEDSVIFDEHDSSANSFSSSNSGLTLTTNLTSSVINSLDLNVSDCITSKTGDISEINELLSRYKIFNKCFECLTDIKENQKIWIDNDSMTIDESPYYYMYLFQSVNRYINNQWRANLFDFFDVKFTEYVRYLDNIGEKLVQNSDNKVFKKLVQDNIRLIDELIPGLDTVKENYKDYEKLSNKISSIILTFIDFKDIIEKQYNIK